MNDFDRGARNATKEDPREALPWMLPGMPTWLSWGDWLDSQLAPRPGEPDRRCDTIGWLKNTDAGPSWCLVIELFTAPDPDAIERALEYVARFRRELRHGPHGRDRYPFLVVLVFLTGAPAVTRFDMRVAGMAGVELIFTPRVIDLSAEDGVAHLEAIEENRLGRSLLVWAPLMKQAQSAEYVARWRVQAEKIEDDQRRYNVVDNAILFAQLTDREEVWKKGLEGMIIQESNFGREIRVKTRRQDTLELLKARFPGEVTEELVERIQKQTDFTKLGEWHILAGTTRTLEAFVASLN